MTKQEKIREGIAELCYKRDFGDDTEIWANELVRYKEPYYKEADALMVYLHDNDVVIKVDRELPSVEEDNPFVRLDEQAKMLKWHEAGLEPLIEELGK